jgi:hypothetical protein
MSMLNRRIVITTSLANANANASQSLKHPAWAENVITEALTSLVKNNITQFNLETRLECFNSLINLFKIMQDHKRDGVDKTKIRVVELKKSLHSEIAEKVVMVLHDNYLTELYDIVRNNDDSSQGQKLQFFSAELSLPDAVNKIAAQFMHSMSEGAEEPWMQLRAGDVSEAAITRGVFYRGGVKIKENPLLAQEMIHKQAQQDAEQEILDKYEIINLTKGLKREIEQDKQTAAQEYEELPPVKDIDKLMGRGLSFTPADDKYIVNWKGGF